MLRWQSIAYEYYDFRSAIKLALQRTLEGLPGMGTDVLISNNFIDQPAGGVQQPDVQGKLA
jgi:hypothetical protein